MIEIYVSLFLLLFRFDMEQKDIVTVIADEVSCLAC